MDSVPLWSARRCSPPDAGTSSSPISKRASGSARRCPAKQRSTSCTACSRGARPTASRTISSPSATAPPNSRAGRRWRGRGSSGFLSSSKSIPAWPASAFPQPTLAASGDDLRPLALQFAMSHLACADAPDDPANAEQRARFRRAARPAPAGSGEPRRLIRHLPRRAVPLRPRPPRRRPLRRGAGPGPTQPDAAGDPARRQGGPASQRAGRHARRLRPCRTDRRPRPTGDHRGRLCRWLPAQRPAIAARPGSATRGCR